MSMNFYCPHCQAYLSAGSEQYGQAVDCPQCSQALTVPKPPSPNTPTAPMVDPTQDEVIKFLCPHCENRLSAVSHQFGKEMPCPHPECNGIVLVPRPEWKPIPTTILKTGSPDTSDLIRQAEQMTRGKGG